MSVRIAPVITREDEEAVLYVRRQVFCIEMGVPMAKLKLPGDSNILQLLARDELTAQPVASLTLVDTSGNAEVNRRYGLVFGQTARSVRYTQLGVLKSFRGSKISLRLILEGHRLFVKPCQFDYSWLMFNAGRASSSLLCRLLRFTPGAITVASELGRSRALIRNERTPECEEAIHRVEALLSDFEQPLISLHGKSAGLERKYKPPESAIEIT